MFAEKRICQFEFVSCPAKTGITGVARPTAQIKTVRHWVAVKNVFIQISIYSRHGNDLEEAAASCGRQFRPQRVVGAGRERGRHRPCLHGVVAVKHFILLARHRIETKGEARTAGNTRIHQHFRYRDALGVIGGGRHGGHGHGLHRVGEVQAVGIEELQQERPDTAIRHGDIELRVRQPIVGAGGVIQRDARRQVAHQQLKAGDCAAVVGNGDFFLIQPGERIEHGRPGLLQIKDAADCDCGHQTGDGTKRTADNHIVIARVIGRNAGAGQRKVRLAGEIDSIFAPLIGERRGAVRSCGQQQILTDQDGGICRLNDCRGQHRLRRAADQKGLPDIADHPIATAALGIVHRGDRARDGQRIIRASARCNNVKIGNRQRSLSKQCGKQQGNCCPCHFS